MRAAISRSERSTSARAASSAREWSSCSMSRALAIAAAAWSASARTRATFDELKAAFRLLNAPIAPNTSSPLTSGAATIERIPMSSTTRSVSGAWSKAASFR